MWTRFPTSTPTNIAMPPMASIRSPWRVTFLLKNLALIVPNKNNATSENEIEMGKANLTSKTIYGESGINPAAK